MRLLQNGREDCVRHQHQTSGGEPTTEGGTDEDGQRINWVLSPTGRANAQLEENQLLRKEVIQPHLPVRLPCYDFTPIADPTFDGSLPRVGPPASGVTNFRGVTGGVYKARERIHRSVLICDY